MKVFRRTEGHLTHNACGTVPARLIFTRVPWSWSNPSHKMFCVPNIDGLVSHSRPATRLKYCRSCYSNGAFHRVPPIGADGHQPGGCIGRNHTIPIDLFFSPGTESSGVCVSRTREEIYMAEKCGKKTHTHIVFLYCPICGVFHPSINSV